MTETETQEEQSTLASKTLSSDCPPALSLATCLATHLCPKTPKRAMKGCVFQTCGIVDAFPLKRGVFSLSIALWGTK